MTTNALSVADEQTKTFGFVCGQDCRGVTRPVHQRFNVTVETGQSGHQESLIGSDRFADVREGLVQDSLRRQVGRGVEQLLVSLGRSMGEVNAHGTAPDTPEWELK